MRAAASTSARCENAWGKLPRWRAVATSNSSAYRPERGGDPQEALHQVAGPLHLAHQGQGRDEPEGADEERALLARQAVVGLLGAVAQHEAVVRQLVGDRQDGVAQALVVGLEEVEAAGQERRGVEGVGLVVLAQDAALAEAVGQDVRPDLVGGLVPARGQRGIAADLGQRARRGRAPPSTSASTRRSAAAFRGPPRCPGPAPSRCAWRTRPGPGRSARAAAAAARCAGCAAGSSRARRRRRRSGAGRTRRCRSARAALRRTPRGRRGSTR